MTFPELSNDTLLRVIEGRPASKTPVWIMRQAGRYLPEFRELRKQHSFFEICQTPELACEITLQPIIRYSPLFDASIIFSDILVVPQALGMEVQMLPEKGPHFPSPLRKPADIDGMLNANVDVGQALSYVFEAITLTRSRLAGRVPLLGFCGAPWTLMAYMIEGGGSKTFSKAKRWLYAFPEDSHRLLQIITDVCVDYVCGQAKAGAQLVQVFDSWAGELSPELFQLFSLPYLQQIVSRVKRQTPIPMTVFAKGAHYATEWLLQTDYDCISLDYTADVCAVKKLAREYLSRPNCSRQRIVFQGNMDPVVLFSDQQTVARECEKTLYKFLINEETGELEQPDRIGYVCNLGHGIQPEVPVENVQVFLETVKRVSEQIFSMAKKNN